MSKFKVGDWWDIQDASYEMVADLVDELEQDGWYVEGYIQMNGLQECVRWPRIGLRPECGTITLFTNSNYDFEESRKLPLSVIGQTECPYTLIEELQANIESLEELVSEQAERIRELESLQEIESEGEFKPVREYTLKDWASAMVSGWKFECRNGNIVTIEHLDSFSNSPVFCSNHNYHNINGMWDDTTGEDADDIIRRIS